VNIPSGDPASKAAAEAEAAIREYEFSRDRYMHTLRADAEAKVLATVTHRREKLMEEVNNLRALARIRSDARAEAMKAYAQRCPGRVSATSFLPPSAADKVGNFGVDKLFKAAVKANEEMTEVSEILKKRRDALDAIDTEMKAVLAKHYEDLIRALETPTGLENAFKRDPLLGRAHARMKAAIERRDALRNAAATPGSAAS
jgi:Skp family chaperone for outer membrane proteins